MMLWYKKRFSSDDIHCDTRWYWDNRCWTLRIEDSGIGTLLDINVNGEDVDINAYYSCDIVNMNVWSDAASLKTVDFEDFWPPVVPREGEPFENATCLMDATRALTCTDANADDTEVEAAISQCTFYQIEIKNKAQRSSYFYPKRWLEMRSRASFEDDDSDPI